MHLSWVDWLIMLVVLRVRAGHRLRAKAVHADVERFLPCGAVDPGVGVWTCVHLGEPGCPGSDRNGASGAKYGIITSHFYWIGAIPAMLFVGLFMMPFYYGSKARSVPEYLRLRYDEKTRAVNAFSFAVMTVFSSGISMYAMALLIQTRGLLHGIVPDAWIFDVSVAISAVIVLGYIFLGGLTSAIYNEVLQFFLIVAGFCLWCGLDYAMSVDGRASHARCRRR